ncbi:hypothetical protein WR25_02078 [Diploscapter pachys]|uniref:Peptidase M28 domain-containing protein n=1 Tax=Diploscapter pachys TaxID=2018661 RepID=A0A2A2K6F0_9BILA|nr:hypothetical protein WR25_02078 [Diploscapter pachys]
MRISSFFLSTLCVGIGIGIVSSQLADVDRMQHDLAKFLSIARYNETQKAQARAGIKMALDSVGLPSMTHTFIHEETNEIGMNVIAVHRGPYYGTADDKLIVMCANYDTLEGSPGVDDNGSGVAALLEAARIMVTLDALYRRQYSILYLFADMKHKGLAGSHAFVEDVLLPLLQRSNSTITGAVVVDGLLHFDPFPSSQAMPDSFTDIFPDSSKELHDHKHMGDFIQVTSRDKKDEAIFHKYVAAFSRSTTALASEWSFRPWLLPLKIPIDRMANQLYKLHPYLYSDHSSFFFHSNQDIELPTIYITDTLANRGVRQYCPHCDGLYMLTEQNVKFLVLLTDSLVRFLIDLSQSEAAVLIDDLHSMLFADHIRHGKS